MFNGLTHMHRPVVLGPLVGLVLGDLHTGILTGGTLELVWMGLAPLAGAQPPNVIIGTIVGTAFAITTGVNPMSQSVSPYLSLSQYRWGLPSCSR